VNTSQPSSFADLQHQHSAGAFLDQTADVPGAGPVLVSEQPSILRGSEYRPGELPEPLHSDLVSEERQSLLAQLLFTARQLALESLTYWKGRPVLCIICGGTPKEGVIEHRAGCAVGRVGFVIERLCQNAERSAKEGGRL
jgi:hypothetical protein